MNNIKNKICIRCILDTTVTDIKFDDNGICNFCQLQDNLEKRYQLGTEGEKNIQRIILEIKKRSRNKKYDCIIGISGGGDSTYCAYLAKKWGLRVLVVHLDNGRNTKEAEHKI